MMTEESKTPLCCSKFPREYESVSPKIIDNLDVRSQKDAPTLMQAVSGAQCTCLSRMVVERHERTCNEQAHICLDTVRPIVVSRRQCYVAFLLVQGAYQPVLRQCTTTEQTEA